MDTDIELLLSEIHPEILSVVPNPRDNCDPSRIRLPSIVRVPVLRSTHEFWIITSPLKTDV